MHLTTNTVPNILVTAAKLDLITEPRGRVLAWLIVMCINSALESCDTQNVGLYNSQKRNRTEFECEKNTDDAADDTRPSKLRRLLCNHDLADDTPMGLVCMDKADDGPRFVMDDPMSKALVALFKLFNMIVSSRVVSQRSWFVFTILEETAHCKRNHANNVLQFMPVSLVSQLMKCLPRMFSTDLILSLSDSSTNLGRKITAKILCEHQSMVSIRETYSLTTE